MTSDALAESDDPRPRHFGMFGPLPSSEHYHGPIWHFTDAAALVNIVKGRHLWASAATVMNDLKELSFGAERIKLWYEQNGDELDGGADVHVILTKHMRTLVDDVVRNPAYVVSASTDFRVLNQWRNYGGTKGVAIRLEPHAELTPVDPPMMRSLLFAPQWVEVAYSPSEQDARIRKVLNSFIMGPIGELFDSRDLASADLFIGAVLASLAASMKDDAFSEEKEVRLISWIPEHQQPVHRGTDRGVVPYIEIMHYQNAGWALAGLERLAQRDAMLPILEIRVGPPEGESERQRRIGVESLLRANGYDIPVNGSTIAYLPA